MIVSQGEIFKLTNEDMAWISDRNNNNEFEIFSNDMKVLLLLKVSFPAFHNHQVSQKDRKHVLESMV
jgi:hypothetical protein